VFTLFLTPVIYSLVAGLAKPRAREGERLRHELDEADAIAAGGTPAE